MCENFRDTYNPLYLQYFTRFFGGDEAVYRAEEAVSGGYGSYNCIIEFIERRSEYLPEMLGWIDNFYATHTVYNSELVTDEPEPVQKKKIKKLSVIAKKGASVVKVKTVKRQRL